MGAFCTVLGLRVHCVRYSAFVARLASKLNYVALYSQVGPAWEKFGPGIWSALVAKYPTVRPVLIAMRQPAHLPLICTG